MVLRYDYDIFWNEPFEFGEMPQGVGGDPNTALPREARGKYRARFRDLATVEALRGAAPEMRALFEASGFGLSRSITDLPDGVFAAKDLAARTDVTERLTENLAGLSFRTMDANGLCLSDFIAHEIAARPINPKVTKSLRERALDPLKLAQALRKRVRFPTVNPLGLALLALLAFILPRLYSSFLSV